MTKWTDWTPEKEARLRELYASPGTTIESIAIDMGLVHGQVNHRARKLGLVKAARVRDYPVIQRGDTWVALSVPGCDDRPVFIDADRLEWFSAYLWHGHTEAYGLIYVLRSNSTKLHRTLLNATAGQIVDHKDRNTLNNRSSNLRFVTHSQNSCNSGRRHHAASEFKGVWRHVSGLFGGAITAPSGRRVSIGYYKTQYAAARARDAMAIHLHGEYAFLNLPSDPMTDDEIAAAPTLRRTILEGTPHPRRTAPAEAFA